MSDTGIPQNDSWESLRQIRRLFTGDFSPADLLLLLRHRPTAKVGTPSFVAQALGLTLWQFWRQLRRLRTLWEKPANSEARTFPEKRGRGRPNRWLQWYRRCRH